MNKPKSYVKKYKDYREGQGWGCGYVDIPLGHPFCILEDLDMIYDIPFGLDLASWQEDDMLTIGFDTRHLRDESHLDKAWVEEQTAELLNYVNNFTKDDAIKALDKWAIGKLTRIFINREHMNKEYNLNLR